eukprot:13502542-Heterocapsa_arctica.AAC.1
MKEVCEATVTDAGTLWLKADRTSSVDLLEYLPAYNQEGDCLAAHHRGRHCGDSGSLIGHGWQHCRLITEVGRQHRHH